MTDREMLELAARAAEFRCWRFDEDGNFQVKTDPLFAWENWNPVTDFSEVFRLLCRKSMRIVEERDGTYRAVQYTIKVDDGSQDGSEEVREIEIEWPHAPAATSLAITMAAAEIGKAMKLRG